MDNKAAMLNAGNEFSLHWNLSPLQNFILLMFLRQPHSATERCLKHRAFLISFSAIACPSNRSSVTFNVIAAPHQAGLDNWRPS